MRPSIVLSCARCGRPAHLRCATCGRIACQNCLDEDERICLDCVQAEKKGGPPGRPGHPPSRKSKGQPGR